MTSMFGTSRTTQGLRLGPVFWHLDVCCLAVFAVGALSLTGCGENDDGQPTSKPSSVDTSKGKNAPSKTGPITSIQPIIPSPTGTGSGNSRTPSPATPTPSDTDVNPEPGSAMPVSTTREPTIPGSTIPGSTIPTSEHSEPTPRAACNIVATGEVSPKIATVGIVTFTSDVPVESAKIEFRNVAGGETSVAPVDVEADDYRTLLLGMKPNSTYTYKVIINDSCSSVERTLTTGNVPVQAVQKIPRISKVGRGGMPGFYVVSVYSGDTHSVILDQDGDIVWYGAGATASNFDSTSRSRMDWEGKYMWSIAANATPGGEGAVRRVSMDGLEETTILLGTGNPHHDLVAVPGGTVTFIAHQEQGECSRIVEFGPDGAMKEIVADINTIYDPAKAGCHPNSISYNLDDDTYVVGDRNANLFVKLSRDGQVIWQLGGERPRGASFSGGMEWNVNHGHHLFEQDGQLRFLLFSNGQGGSSYVIELALNEDRMTAEQLWRGVVASTPVMGDVQRLPNGNTLVALTTAGTIAEIEPGTTDSVQEFRITGGQVGYVDYRATLYGIPAKARFDYTRFD